MVTETYGHRDVEVSWGGGGGGGGGGKPELATWGAFPPGPTTLANPFLSAELLVARRPDRGVKPVSR